MEKTKELFISKIETGRLKYNGEIYSSDEEIRGARHLDYHSFYLQYFKTTEIENFDIIYNHFHNLLFSENKLEKKGDKTLKTVLANIVASLWYGFLWVRFYKNKNKYYPKSWKTAWISYKHFDQIMTKLQSHGYIYIKSSFHGTVNKICRFMPTLKLANELNNCKIDCLLSKSKFTIDKTLRPLIQFKDKDKNVIEIREHTREIQRMERKLGRINEAYKRHKIELALTKEELLHIIQRVNSAPDFSNIKFFRTFNYCDPKSNGRDLLRFGGRLYDEIIQIPSAYRNKIIMDGEETIELDYSGLFLTLLYSMAGEAPEGDVYTLDYDEVLQGCVLSSRDIGKIILNRMINSNKQWVRGFCSGVYAQMNKRLEKKYNIKIQTGKNGEKMKYKRPEGISSSVVYDYVELLLIKHRRIADLLFDKFVGYQCFKIESEITMKILDHFLLQKNIPILPYHDSYIIAKRHKEELNEKMIQFFQEVSGAKFIPVIK